MSTAILISIILITLVYVFWPYLNQKIYLLDHDISDESGTLLDLIESRDNILSTIKDLEFDYNIGKLSTEDFTKMNTQYRSKAINLFKKIELQKHEKGNKKIENEMSKIQIQNGKNSCAVCNHPLNNMDRFCVNCGNQLPDEEN